MMCDESYTTNHLNEAPNGRVASEQEESEAEKDNQGKSNEEDTATAELFVRLTDMVRKHYCGYLEKQLLENVQVWRANTKFDEGNQTASGLDDRALKECCRLLEDRALKACMHARRYQRTMLKIIAEVRRNTQEFRLEEDLRKLLITTKTQKSADKGACVPKSTQTDESALRSPNKPGRRKRPTTESPSKMNEESPPSLTLQQKIEMFQQRLNQETAAIVAATHKNKKQQQHYSKTRRHSSNNHNNHNKPTGRRRQKLSADGKLAAHIELFEKPDRIVMPPPPCINTTQPKASKQNKISEIEQEGASLPVVLEKTLSPAVAANNVSTDNYLLEQDDEIAKELDQLFCEEKSELEELLGLSTSAEIDDPQVLNVLEEIQKAPLSHELPIPATTRAESTHICMDSVRDSPVNQQVDQPPSPQSHMHSSPIIDLHYNDLNSQTHHHTTLDSKTAPTEHSVPPTSNLKHSLWPCELYMQRRRLTESLSRLIEEDFRWLDIMKWKFQTLFGEDSDDEFATCSPSIELDEILISSCIRRISPWIVKHLMKPMHDGLIANRFLFKKLAKRLAHTIVLENQYPDERLIKCVVEEYFCLHQAVLSLEDMTEMPNMKLIVYTT